MHPISTSDAQPPSNWRVDNPYCASPSVSTAKPTGPSYREKDPYFCSANRVGSLPNGQSTPPNPFSNAPIISRSPETVMCRSNTGNSKRMGVAIEVGRRYGRDTVLYLSRTALCRGCAPSAIAQYPRPREDHPRTLWRVVRVVCDTNRNRYQPPRNRAIGSQREHDECADN